MIKQLIPCTYVTTYIRDDKKWLCIWKMWFGKSYNIREYQLVN